MLVQQAEDARALAHAAKDRAQVLATKVVQLGNARAPEVELAKAADQAERAQDLQQTRYRAWQDAEQLVTRVNAWLRELPHGTKLEAAPTPLVTTSGSPQVVVGEIRSKIAALAIEFHRIMAAGPTRDDARAQIGALVQSLAARGRPRIDVQRGEVAVQRLDGRRAECSHAACRRRGIHGVARS